MEAFSLDFDDDNNSPSQISYNQTAHKDKYQAKTITKGFFNSLDQQEDAFGGYSINEKEEHQDKKEEQKNRIRRRKPQVKLEPLAQQKKVEVFANVNREQKTEQVEEYELEVARGSVEEKESQNKQHHTFLFQDDEPQALQQPEQQPLQREPASSSNTRVVEERTVNNIPENAQIPGRNVLGQFSMSQGSDGEDDQIVEVAGEFNVVGSEYYNYQSVQSLQKQLLAPIRPGFQLRMELMRDKSGFNTFWPQFHLSFSSDEHYLMSAKKTSSKPCSTFILTSNKSNYQENSAFYVGKAKSNILGDMLNIFGPGLNPSNARQKNITPRQLLATVVYESHLFQVGKPRQFTVYTKKKQVQYYKAFSQVRMYEDQIPLSQLYLHSQNRDKIVRLHNRKPRWIQELGGYMLNFRGRVQVASIKNFILEDDQGKEVMLFGRVNESKFNLDMMTPLSAVIAFGIVLSTFDSRIMCE